ncbi:MAG: DSD1 family PLP-dependent enzyme [Gammaproteobacteria bacterium]|nr:DSD1 family PLP-dependent enzyme [Gammaproteobacteria bacterium]
MKRRHLLAGAVVGGAGLLWGWRASNGGDRGGNHSASFQALSAALDRAGLARPTLVIDKQKLLANADVLKQHLAGKYHYRVVAKSLPSLPLLQAVMTRTHTRRLMVFHQPFLNLIARELPDTELLLGKPMPVAAAARFYEHHRNPEFDAREQLQWLVDSGARLQQYAELARQRGELMQINLELDVGLHRGGFSENDAVIAALALIEREPGLQFSGFMGYDPHVAKTPGLLGGPDKAFAAVQQRYQEFVDVAEKHLGRSLSGATLNAAGSPTYQRYDGQQVATELAAGSALVKPTDFDLDSLADHQPAAFIATPVLKSLPVAQVPGIEKLARLQSWFNPNTRQAFFIYGGYWKALPESPPGLSTHALYGRSTNQEMLNGSASITLQPDDWVFLRPTQSEHVFLQFGDIAVYEGGDIVDSWPVFTQGA